MMNYLVVKQKLLGHVVTPLILLLFKCLLSQVSFSLSQVSFLLLFLISIFAVDLLLLLFIFIISSLLLLYKCVCHGGSAG